MSGFGNLGQTLIVGFLASPSSRNHSPKLILLAHFAIDESSIGIPLLIKLLKPQVFIPLIVNKSLTRELELGVVVERTQVH